MITKEEKDELIKEILGNLSMEFVEEVHPSWNRANDIILKLFYGKDEATRTEICQTQFPSWHISEVVRIDKNNSESDY